MEDDRARLEQGETVLLISRDLAEWMQRQVRRLLLGRERNETNVISLAGFLERPVYARIARQALPAIGRTFESGDGDGHRNTPSRQCISTPRMQRPHILSR